MRNLKPCFFTIMTIALVAVGLTTGAAAQTAVSPNQNKMMEVSATVTGVPANPADISPLLIGETIPSVVLPDATGKSFNLNESMASKPTILVFYRGGWCPFCRKQLSGMQTIEGDLTKMGYQIIAISTDSPENLTKTMGKQHLTYTLLSDSELSASKKFGIAYVGPKNYEKTLIEGSNGKNVDKLLPVPSVFILDGKGVIKFEYINPDFKQRISPELLKAAAGALMAETKTKS
ncbi:AhpC/TSA family protein [Pedobacter frigidisoli]|uniref:thioredoxin-dependent peroxiredoxin n=1 Tax=Pedobacter frigidisoli TaxID=2530455 RepID=A0A4R0NFQ4_9SPHI|nr:peroxiredoxin-like family protein [Pedobacter frigidisoli]TCC98123.1 AhpC/TSA family protein [Pedobacter frigidisoli]